MVTEELKMMVIIGAALALIGLIMTLVFEDRSLLGILIFIIAAILTLSVAVHMLIN